MTTKMEEVIIPSDAWSWRFENDYVLTAILDQDGEGPGLHRTDGGPCWISPYLVGPRCPKEQDQDRKWYKPAIVFTKNAGTGGQLRAGSRSCRKCGSTCTADGPPAPLCTNCSNECCEVCKMKLRKIAKVRCKPCGRYSHVKCAQTAWEGGTHCAHPACNIPSLSGSTEPPKCTRCKKITLFDSGSKQCPGCRRDRCAQHARVTSSCRRCVELCTHSRPRSECRECPVWWYKPSSDPTPLNKNPPSRNKLLTAMPSEP